MNKQHFIFILLIMLSLMSCGKKWQKKYPEDDGKTKLTPTERLVDKWWLHTSTTLNGVDVTNDIRDSLGEYKLHFSTASTPAVKDRYYADCNTTVFGDILSVWRFENSDANISIFQASLGSTVSYFMPCFINSGTYTGYPEVLKLSEAALRWRYMTKNGDSIIINNFVSQ